MAKDNASRPEPNSEGLSEKDILIQKDRRLFGHPRALFVPFSLELWERFSFYGMQSILAIYIYFSVADGGLGLPVPTAIGIVGAYGAAIYLSTLLGGWIADRLLGPEPTMFYSSIVIMIGHVVLAAFPGRTGLVAALVMISLGAGGLKATAAAIAGSLYGQKDTRRDAGFLIYYMAIMTGAIFGPLASGLLQDIWGFHFGFGIAAAGMAIGLVIYISSRNRLPDQGKIVPNPLGRSERWIPVCVAFVVGVAVVLATLSGILTIENVSQWITAVVVLLLVFFYLMIARSKVVTTVERAKMFALLPILLCTSIFFALVFQIMGVVINYADTEVDRSIGSWVMPIAWIVSVYSIMVVVFGPVFSFLWAKMGVRQPSAATKIGISLPLTGVGFLMFLPFANPDERNATPLLWLVLILFVIAIAELMNGPIGVSVATKAAPKAFTTQVVGIYYLSIAIGSTLSGILGGLYDAGNQVPYWLTLGCIAIIIGLGQLMIAKRLTRVLNATG